jgi:hypothetical protein
VKNVKNIVNYLLLVNIISLSVSNATLQRL